jgi:UDP-glucose:(heptosyl)LPS alpha-1,3-glucosyltransferase
VKLAICHPVVVPARGGCETYVTSLLRRLRADGHQIRLYASQWDVAALPGGTQVYRVADRGWPRFLRPWRFSQACQEALRHGDHDLSIGFDKVAGVDVLYPQGGLHLAALAHGLAKEHHPLRRTLARAARAVDPSHLSFSRFERHQYLSGRPPFVIAISDLVRRHFQDYLGIPRDRVEVLHCAIDPERFAAADRLSRRDTARRAWRVEAGDVAALFVAMNYRLKGLVPLLHAVARLPRPSRFRLVVAGDPRTAPYEALARRLGIAEQVRFVGFQADPRDAYFAADLLVHPTFYDPCSLVVLEAMACGLPVVTTRHNGAAELLDPPHDGAVIDDPHDHAALAASLQRLLDPTERQQASKAALRGGQKWTFEMHYRRLLSLLRQAALRRRAA